MRFLSKKEMKDIRRRLDYIDPEVLGDIFRKYKRILVTNIEKRGIILYLYYELPIFFEIRGQELLYPTLNLLYDYGFIFLPIVKVDSGAVPYICNGADIMAPGVIEFDKDIRKGTIVCIINPEGHPIAIGKALVDYEDFIKLNRGKVVENVHHLRDFIWNYRRR